MAGLIIHYTDLDWNDLAVRVECRAGTVLVEPVDREIYNERSTHNIVYLDHREVITINGKAYEWLIDAGRLREVVPVAEAWLKTDFVQSFKTNR